MNCQKMLLRAEQLLNVAPSFKLLGYQLNFLANCPDEFDIKPTKEVQIKARKYYDHLIKNGQVNDKLGSSLIYLQSRKLVASFIDTLILGD